MLRNSREFPIQKFMNQFRPIDRWFGTVEQYVPENFKYSGAVCKTRFLQNERAVRGHPELESLRTRPDL